MEAVVVILTFLAIGAIIAIGIRQGLVLPRKRGALLASELAQYLSLKIVPEDRLTQVEGLFEDHLININISDGGYPVVQVNLLKPVISASYRVYETTGWSYQKWENRASGLTVDSGDSAFDAKYDVYDDTDKEAARKLNEKVRRVLVEQHQKGLAVIRGRVTLGEGSVTPFGYFGGRAVSDSCDRTVETLRQALAIAIALEECA